MAMAAVGLSQRCHSACGLAVAGRESGGRDGGGLALAVSGWWCRSACMVGLSGCWQRDGRAVALVGVPRSCRGCDVHVVAGQKSSSWPPSAMSGMVGVGHRMRLCRGRRAAASGFLKNGSDNQHVVGGDVWQDAGMGEGTASAMVDAFCGNEEEVVLMLAAMAVATTATAAMAAAMLLRWRLQEQALVNEMRAGGERRMTRWRRRQ